MIYSDLNIHLCSGENLSQLLRDDFTLQRPELLDRIKKYMVCAGPELKSANLMLFNSNLSAKDVNAISSLCATYADKDIFLTLLVSPDHISSCNQLSSLKSSGLSAITFHSYHQCISKSKYSDYAKLAVWAEELGMPVLVDGSYGTLDIYNIDNLDFVAYLASIIKNVPIVIIHSGGARVLEAMLLVESTSNLFLETSFTLPYYAGSSIEDDLAFAYKKIGSEKVVYASDDPYITQQASLSAAINFFDKYNFSLAEQEWILSKSFSLVFNS